ncbi:MAG: NUDIX domain-containing protein [Oscillospiraceae bacterium]|nr:NUDIX domain-containing protein [Oscillospiraceae bacterium]
MKFVSVLIQKHAGPTGDVLICKTKDGKWCFPSTKVRTNEYPPEAAERAAWEQLGIKIVPGKLAMIGHKMPSDGIEEHIANGNIRHNTNTKALWHSYYEAVNKWQTEPKTDVYDELKWVHRSELGQYEFEGDDQNFMAKYDPWVNGREIPDVRMY